MSTNRACDCGAPRCEREGCQDKPTPRHDTEESTARKILREQEARKGGAGMSTNANTMRDLAEQTLDGTLPYEESWHENATNVLALLAEVEQLRTENEIQAQNFETQAELHYKQEAECDDAQRIARNALNENGRHKVEIEQLRAALDDAGRFAELVLQCDHYGCKEAGPGKCLHAKAAHQLEALRAVRG